MRTERRSPQGLNVVSQEVVNIEAGPGNGWRLIETGMGAMPVVAVDPGSEVGESVGGVLVELGVGPFADGGLDEAFGFAVGAWGVDAGADRSDTEAAAGGGEAARTETGPLSVRTRRTVIPKCAK